MEKETAFLYEQDRLKNVIELINKKIKIAQQNFNKQEHTIIGFKEGQRGTQFIRQGLMSLYATEVKDLESILSNPYFGMFRFKNNSSKVSEIYLGKKAILDDNAQAIAYDWRSPICSMYYDYNIGKAAYTAINGAKESGEILKKRQIIIKNGELIDVEEQDTLSNDSVLLRYLKENADARLKSIIATIQREQNLIIRSPLNKDYIIQGVAGSGKTTVALHRIAYLLYNEAKNINESDFMIMGPNKYFLNYISELLPDLDINNVTQLTFEEIALDTIGLSKIKLESRNTTLQEVLSGNIDEKIIKFKSSIAYLKMIEKFINLYVTSHFNEDIVYEGTLICDSESIKRYFNSSVYASEKGYKERIENFMKYLIKKVKDNSDDLAHNVWLRYRDEYLRLPKNDPKRQEILEEVDIIQKEIKKGCPTAIKNYFKFVKTSPIVLYQSFVENINVIYSNEGHDFSKLQEYTYSKISKKQIGYDDLPPLMLISYVLNGKKNFKEYSYLAIDEAQDLSMAQYYMLKKLFPKAKFNVFGDVNQSIYDYQSVQDWNELNNTIFDSKASILELNKSYRTTVNISDASNLILKQLNKNFSECIARTGDELSVCDDISVQSILSQIKTLLEKNYQSIAIICKDDNETKKAYEKLKKTGVNVSIINEKSQEYNGGLCVIPSYLSKGLEFDAVIIYNANNINYGISSIDMKLLYVAMTRAMHSLYINYEGKLPYYLKPLLKTSKVLKKAK